MYIEIRKKQTYLFLVRYYRAYGEMPLLWEIGAAAYIGGDPYQKRTLTPQRVWHILRELEKDGKIEIEKRKRRGIKIKDLTKK